MKYELETQEILKSIAAARLAKVTLTNLLYIHKGDAGLEDAITGIDGFIDEWVVKTQDEFGNELDLAALERSAIIEAHGNDMAKEARVSA